MLLEVAFMRYIQGHGVYTVDQKVSVAPDDYSKNTQKYFKQFQSLTMIT
jgi:hypothetical protein